MEWYEMLIAGIMLSFWGWVAIKVIENSAKIADIQRRITEKDKLCAQHLTWLSRLEKKLDRIAEDSNRVNGTLNLLVKLIDKD